MTIDRSGFMEILGEIWSTWTTKNSLVEASRGVGIAVDGLSADWMQQDKFIVISLPEKITWHKTFCPAHDTIG